MEPVEWQPLFESNYAVLKGLAGKVPANLQGVYNSLMRNAQNIQYTLDNHRAITDATSDGVDNWFFQVRNFAQRIGTVPATQIATPNVTPPDTNWVSDPTFYAMDNIAQGMSNLFSDFEGELETIAFWVAVGIGALLLGPPLIRMVQGRR